MKCLAALPEVATPRVALLEKVRGGDSGEAIAALKTDDPS